MYIVDGHNVMGQRVGWHRDKPGAVRQLVEDTIAFTQRSDAHAILVFDGPPLPDIPEGARIENVTVYFAGHGSIADDRIVDLARERTDRHELTAVTSDRELAGRLRREGVPSIRSGRFRKLLAGLDARNG